jgi:hypothetical protein
MDPASLNAIALELRRIADAKAPRQLLGFGPAPRTTQFIFCNRKNGGLWYKLNEQSQPVIIEQPALTGYIRKLEFKTLERRGKDTPKLHCHIEADTHYTLESGHDSLFSKELLSAIAFTSPKDLREPITIEVQAADNETVLFCNVWVNSQRVMASFDDQTDWKLAARAAIDAVRVANGEAEAMTTLPKAN